MTEPEAAPWDFEAAEGGVKVVFDVPEVDVDDVALAVGGAGFDVHRYYHPDDERGPGGSPEGYVRLGAERAMSEFTNAEQEQAVADFEAVQRSHCFACIRVGVDVWTSGGDDPIGDWEPRAPLPFASAGAAFAEPRTNG